MSKRAGAVVVFLILLSALVVDATNAFAAAPTFTVDATPSASYASAEVSGTVNPADNEVLWGFQYSRDPASEGWSNGPQAFTQTLAANSGSTPVSERLTGLKAGVEYKVRLVLFPTDFSTEWASEEPFVSFETEPVGTPTMTINPPSLAGGMLHLSGTVDPNAPEPAATSNEVEEGFRVDWHFECTPECPGLVGGTVAADNTAHVVEASTVDLQPNTHYEVRLLGTNAGGSTEVGPMEFTTAAVAPHAETAPAFALVGGNKVLLGGRVDTKNSPTNYWFEVGPTQAYGTVVPVARATAGSGGESFVTQELGGLAPTTVYHYRLIAENAAGRSEGEDMTVVTTPASSAIQSGCPNAGLRAENDSEALPACRAYEMVSPPNKNGNDIGAVPGFPLETAAASSETPGIAYESYGALPSSATSITRNFYLGRRGERGWTYNPLSPPQYATTEGGSFPQYTSYSPDLNYAFLRTPTGPSLAPGDTPGKFNLYLRNTDTNIFQTLNLGGPATDTSIIGSSADATHVAFESSTPLTPDAPVGTSSVYEWNNGQVKLASVMPDGTPAPFAKGGGIIGAGNNIQPTKNIVSRDGSRIFFGVREPSGHVNIYVRIDGRRTVKVSGTRRTEPGAEDAGLVEYEGASADGSVVYFTADAPLTDDASGPNLYRFDVDTETLTDISPPGGSEPVLIGTVLGMSEDGSYVYFSATGRLLEGGPTSGVYLWHAGHLSLIAANSDAGSSYANAVTARVTPDGEHAVFMTASRVTAYDNGGATEVYVVDATTGRVTCVSCAPNGGMATSGSSLIGPQKDAQANLQRSVSDSGDRVFFDTAEALVPEDVNNQLDVYAWEDGVIHLISSGTSGSPSFFSDASASGDDVYFITREALVSSDQDENDDLYDARVGGGFPRSVAPARCIGEGCQGARSAAPPPKTTGSESILGRPKAKKLANQRKLQKAIKACKRKHQGEVRKKCIAKARKRYGKNSNGGSK